MSKLTLGEFREFTADMPDSIEIRIASIYDCVNEKSYHTSTDEISGYSDAEGTFIILEPDKIQIIGDEPDEE